MPTPTEMQVPVPVPSVSTPGVQLPCGITIPAIPVLPPFSVSITLPSFPPSLQSKKGAHKSRSASKWADRLAKLKKLCPGVF